MHRRGLADVEPDEEWDPNKKHFLVELKRSSIEKKIFVGTIFILAIAWFAAVQPVLVLHPEWNSAATDKQLSSYLGHEFVSK